MFGDIDFKEVLEQQQGDVPELEVWWFFWHCDNVFELGGFGIWGLLFSGYDCVLVGIRGKEDMCKQDFFWFFLKSISSQSNCFWIFSWCNFSS